MTKHLLLVGGGHAHMVTLSNLRIFIEKGYKVTVIGPSPYHSYSGMGPGMLGRIYAPDDIRSSTQDVVKKQGGTFIIGKAVRADPKGKQLILESGETVPFDPGGDYLLILNMGDGTGGLRKKWLTFDGRLAFKIKDYIDRRFMNKFQIME